MEILRHRYEPVDVQDSGIGFPPESTPRAACCDIQALDSGIPGCARLGDLILDQESVDSVWKRTITFQQDQETENSLVLDEKFAPKTSTGSVSLYSVAIYNCESPGQAFFVSGKVEFVNHYRRLPLQYQRLEKVTLIISLLRANSVKLKNLFKFQKVMLIFYAAITILWTIFLFKSRRDRLHIHVFSPRRLQNVDCSLLIIFIFLGIRSSSLVYVS